MKKRLISAIMIVIMLSLAACSGKDGGKGGKTQEKGRYIQEVKSLPEGESYISLMETLDDGTLRIAGENGIYDSSDDGDTWSEVDYGSEKLNTLMEEEYSMVSGVAMKGDGTIFLNYTRYLDENPYENEIYDSEDGYLLISPDGTEKELDIELPDENDPWGQESKVVSGGEDDDGEEDDDDYEYKRALSEVMFTADGDLIGYDWGDTVFHIDAESGDIIREYTSSEDYIVTYMVYKNYLILRSWENTDIYDLETGNEAKALPAINAFFESDERTSSSSDDYRFIKDEANDCFYIHERATGLYKVTEDASEAELVFDTNDYSLSNPEVFVTKMVVLSEERFLASYHRDGEKSGLLYYSYSEDAEGPEKELTVYSLMQDQEIEQAAASFQEANPQYRVVYKYGFNYENDPSMSDILNTLNTEIMAGAGPDILVLDGLPVASYIDKGILEDLSDTLEELQKSGNYFENIFNTHKQGDGVYGVPTKFNVPVIMGTEEDLNQITDLKSLADYTERMRAEHGEYDRIIGDYYGVSLCSLLLQLSGNSMMKEDGTLDKDMLKEFLTYAKTIYDHNSTDEEERYEGEDEELDDIYYIMDRSDVTGMGIMYALLDREPLLTGAVNGFDGFHIMLGMQEEKNWNWKQMSGFDENIYAAGSSLGVNNRSEEKELAKEFIKYMLSTDRQQKDVRWSGFPVNRDAYTALYEEYMKDAEYGAGSYGYGAEDKDGKEINVEVKGKLGTKEQYEELADMFSQLDAPAFNNTVITAAVCKQAEKCFAGKITTEEAIENILQKINLYLAE